MTKNELIAENERLQAEVERLRGLYDEARFHWSSTAFREALSNSEHRKGAYLNKQRANAKAIFTRRWWLYHRSEYRTKVAAYDAISDLLYTEFELKRRPSHRTISNYLKTGQ